MMQLTKYEKARVIGARALQLAMGAPMILKLSKKDLEDMHYNFVSLAKREFEQDKLPITIKRPLPTKTAE
ncbi:MAG: DNA-directed RNA polymerase subunit K [archaeon]